MQTAIMAIVAKVEKLLDIDEFIDLLWKIGDAQVRVEIELANP